MSYKIGQTYILYKFPITIYYSSDRASKKIKLGSGSTNRTGSVVIRNVAWTDESGNWYYPDKGKGTIPIYAISDFDGKGTIGWIRSDDNYGLTEFTGYKGFKTTDTSSGGVNTITPDLALVRFSLTKPVESAEYILIIRIGDTVITTQRPSYYTQSTTIDYRWTISEVERNSIYQLMSNVTTTPLKLEVVTYIDGRKIGSKHYTLPISIPDYVKPKIVGKPLVTINNPKNSKAYEGLSSVTVSVAVSPSRGSSTTTRITIGNQNHVLNNTSSFTSSVFSTSGTFPITVTATDRRGRSDTWSDSLMVHPYRKPGILLFEAQRQVGNATTVGFKIQGTFTSDVSKPPRVALSQLGVNDSYTTVTLPDDSTMSPRKDQFEKVFSVDGFLANKSYSFRLQVLDDFGNIAYGTAVIGTEEVALTLGIHGVSAGKMFDNRNEANLQVGSGGVDIEGARIRSVDVTDADIVITQSDFTYNGTSLLGGGGGSLQVVKHGNDSTVARPDAETVIWIGVAPPNNGRMNDIWTR